jgi:hypothetical protein
MFGRSDQHELRWGAFSWQRVPFRPKNFCEHAHFFLDAAWVAPYIMSVLIK